MRLASFSMDGRHSYGIVTGDSEIIDLAGRIDGVQSLQELIVSERLDEAHAVAAAEVSPDHKVADVTFETPLARPPKIFCIGVNYGGRNAEYKDGQDNMAKPSVFVRFPSSFTGHDRPLTRPPESEQLDYEGEIVAVIGKGGRRIAESSARDHLAGLTLGNEGTIRDWVRHAKFNVTQGKNWEGSGAIGPWMVTMDQIGEFDSLRLTTKVNGELRQDDTPATMAFSIPFQIAYLSTFTTLEAGDIIFTGTPTGAGARMDPPTWLVPGDVVEVNVPEIGTLRNGIVDELLDESQP